MLSQERLREELNETAQRDLQEQIDSQKRKLEQDARAEVEAKQREMQRQQIELDLIRTQMEQEKGRHAKILAQ